MPRASLSPLLLCPPLTASASAPLSLSLAIAGVGCFAALMHDTTGPRTYSARTISNLALAALVLPGAAVLPLTAANRKGA